MLKKAGLSILALMVPAVSVAEEYVCKVETRHLCSEALCLKIDPDPKFWTEVDLEKKSYANCDNSEMIFGKPATTCQRYLALQVSDNPEFLTLTAPANGAMIRLTTLSKEFIETIPVATTMAFINYGRCTVK